jgi:hypothetical protein
VAIRHDGRTPPKRCWAALRTRPLYLNVQQRGCGHLRAKPRQFTVVSNRTARVDMDTDTSIRSNSQLLVRDVDEYAEQGIQATPSDYTLQKYNVKDLDVFSVILTT